MANNVFDRTVINARERPVSTDINQAQSQIERTIRYYMDQFLLPRVSNTDPQAGSPISGFLNDAFRITEANPAALSVVVKDGLGFKFDASDTPSAIGGVGGVDDLSRYKPLLLLADATIAVPAADPTNPRIDIIEANINRRLTDPSDRDILNATTGVFDSTNVNKILAWNVGTSIGTVTTPANNTAALGYKVGIPGATPAIPPTSPGYVKVAEILVSNGVTQINQNDINDLRPMLAMSNIRRVIAQGAYVGGGVALNALKAPPGVEVAFNVNAGDTQRRMYVKAGFLTGAVPMPQVTIATSASTVRATTSIVNTDTTLQTNLANPALTDPILQVVADYPGVSSSGQKLIEVDILPGNLNDTFNVTVEW